MCACVIHSLRHMRTKHENERAKCASVFHQSQFDSFFFSDYYYVAWLSSVACARRYDELPHLLLLPFFYFPPFIVYVLLSLASFSFYLSIYIYIHFYVLLRCRCYEHSNPPQVCYIRITFWYTQFSRAIQCSVAQTHVLSICELWVRHIFSIYYYVIVLGKTISLRQFAVAFFSRLDSRRVSLLHFDTDFVVGGFRLFQYNLLQAISPLHYQLFLTWNWWWRW